MTVPIALPDVKLLCVANNNGELVSYHIYLSQSNPQAAFAIVPSPRKIVLTRARIKPRFGSGMGYDFMTRTHGLGIYLRTKTHTRKPILA
jgi:hypothetical protein